MLTDLGHGDGENPMFRGLLIAVLAIAFGFGFAPHSRAQFGGGPSMPGTSGPQQSTTVKSGKFNTVERRKHIHAQKRGGKSGPAGIAVSDPGEPYHIKATSKSSDRKSKK